MSEGTFDRALAGEPVSEAEVRAMWASAPVTYVSPQEYDALCALLEEPPKVNPKLAKLVRRTQA